MSHSEIESSLLLMQEALQDSEGLSRLSKDMLVTDVLVTLPTKAHDTFTVDSTSTQNLGEEGTQVGTGGKPCGRTALCGGSGVDTDGKAITGMEGCGVTEDTGKAE